jgi:L-arabinose isomerase
LLHIYPNDQAILLSHCGNGSFHIARGYSDIELQSVRLADKGLCVLFPAKPGPMTLINLLGRRNTYRMCILEGDSIETTMEFAGNPLKFRLPMSTDDFLEMVKQNGFGHHWIGGYGKFCRELELLCKIAGLTYKCFF